MSTFNHVHARRVEKLAQVVEKSHAYSQYNITHNCGTPACMAGYAEAVFKPLREEAIPAVMFLQSDIRRFLFGECPEKRPARDVWERDVFSCGGCNNAGRSGKKAAAYIRQMAADLKAALANG